MNYKYGTFANNQIAITKTNIRKSIFFLLLCVDPATKDDYAYINVDIAFNTLLHKLNGFNSILYEPSEMVTVISLLERALQIYHSDDFSFKTYRKLILDAGAEICKIKEDGDYHA